MERHGENQKKGITYLAKHRKEKRGRMGLQLRNKMEEVQGGFFSSKEGNENERKEGKKK